MVVSAGGNHLLMKVGHDSVGKRNRNGYAVRYNISSFSSQLFNTLVPESNVLDKDRNSNVKRLDR